MVDITANSSTSNTPSIAYNQTASKDEKQIIGAVEYQFKIPVLFVFEGGGARDTVIVGVLEVSVKQDN